MRIDRYFDDLEFVESKARELGLMFVNGEVSGDETKLNQLNYYVERQGFWKDETNPYFKEWNMLSRKYCKL